MRRSNFVLGIGASVVLHAMLLLLVQGQGRGGPRPASPPPALPIQIVSVDPDEKVPLDPLPEDPLPADPLPLEPPPSEPLPLVPLLEPPVKPGPELPAHAPAPAPVPTLPILEPVAARPVERAPEPQPPAPISKRTETVFEPPPVGSAGHAADDGASEVVAPLRVHWRDAAELRSVARALGMRLAAVDRHRNIIAEIDLNDPPSLKRWQGVPYGYSNRVRMLSPSIFSGPLSGDLADRSVVEIHEVWIFVPSDRDRAMIDSQNAAVRRLGLRPQDVLYVDGRFVRSANGLFRLDITNIAPRRRGHG